MMEEVNSGLGEAGIIVLLTRGQLKSASLLS